MAFLCWGRGVRTSPLCRFDRGSRPKLPALGRTSRGESAPIVSPRLPVRSRLLGIIKVPGDVERMGVRGLGAASGIALGLLYASRDVNAVGVAVADVVPTSASGGVSGASLPESSEITCTSPLVRAPLASSSSQSEITCCWPRGCVLAAPRVGGPPGSWVRLRYFLGEKPWWWLRAQQCCEPFCWVLQLWQAGCP